jgi:hypothetical protein
MAATLARSGQPRAGVRLTGADVFAIPFSLAWCGFAVFWEMSVLKSDAPGFFALFGLIFVAMGLYMVFGRFIADAIRREKTCYGLTSRRAIIVSGVFGREVKSIDLVSLGELTVSERSDRSGTISLGTPANINAWGPQFMGPSWPGVAKFLPPAFEMIENVKAVFEKIREQRGR